MTTSSATRALAALDTLGHRVVRADQLTGLGWRRAAVRAQLDAGRWRRIGRAIVLANGPLTHDDRLQVALVNAGAVSALTSFTAVAGWGLTGWERAEVEVIVPGGTSVRRVAEVDVRVHYVGDWRRVRIRQDKEAPAGALIRAAGSLANPRMACGLLAAGVQQRLVTPAQLASVLDDRRRTRHRAALIPAVHDIAQGAQALSEIDFARLCRGAGLPEPVRQRVRHDSNGRRRYVDADWDLPGGRRLLVEVDGAVHLVATQWWSDQLRQNDLALITRGTVLRFPSVIVRLEPALVVAQLRRALR